jgi:hypothetical protein
MSEHDVLSGIRLSWPAPLQGAMQGAAHEAMSGAERAAASASRQPISPVLPMMRGWTLPTPPSIPSLPT